ncbi:MAG: D-aminoacyl-tRNA deacylase [Dehalococcoidia bacterium]
MRAVIQRVSLARVSVGGETIGEIGPGLLVLLGVAKGDAREQCRKLAAKTAALRIFEDAAGKMNRDVVAAGGSILCVSQFTLYGDARRGNRPSFERAAPGSDAEPLYEEFCAELEQAGLVVQRGRFGAEMKVELVNDGPVTVILDTDELEQPRRA